MSKQLTEDEIMNGMCPRCDLELEDNTCPNCKLQMVQQQGIASSEIFLGWRRNGSNNK